MSRHVISCRWGFGFYFAHMRSGFIATCSLHENDEMYILNLRHTLFNVHKVTFRYSQILPNSTIHTVYNYINTITKLFGVCVVNYEVMDLQKWDKCNRSYFLHTKFVRPMWEHE